ncbi:hypothetical protein NE237_031185 [Protea cynaroides]|uniref:Pentatricopeptide repeat-containing protein n=1 Tax=Protea cynaroides TaxID=273540 RepID=A0A9Q0L0M6_9MAGN|nr:hypothetical protein NE237_031185 [Protea cynaroides]
MGFLQSTFLCNNIIHAYTENVTIDDAQKLFGEMTEPNVVSWTNLIFGYTQMGKLAQAVSLFRRMQEYNSGVGKEGHLPNCFTFGSILKGCTHTKDLQTGMQIHCAIVKFGFECDTFIGSTLVHMYGKCGQIEGSWRVFAQTQDRDVVTWTSMITGFANHMHPEFKNAAFVLFKDMIRNGIWPLGITFCSLAKVFQDPARLNQAKQVHGCLIKLGIEVDCQLGSSLIDMYGKCEGIEEAIRIFLRLDQKDVVSWTSLLVSYLNNGFYVEAIDVFCRMVVEKIPIDQFVIAGVVGVCSHLEKMASGKEVHAFAIRKGFISDVSVGNSIITFYGRWGDVKTAKNVFQSMEVQDAISWTALLACFTQTGFAEEALFLFQKMLRTSLSLPVFIITCAMRACSTIASLSVANQLHSRTIKHFHSMALSAWSSRVQGNIKLGKFAAEKILQMKPGDPSAYILLSSFHASMGMWDQKANVLMMMRDQNVRRQPSQSWIELQLMNNGFDNSVPICRSSNDELGELKKLDSFGRWMNKELGVETKKTGQLEYIMLEYIMPIG